ncbi:phospholipase D-like domain-containing protein [Niallia sp. Krafla_26]|uniref:phospholipase D-like domain-containing protein n=1 Tax=Niallia sp. Krafla_26 TaxID=3064703 RepID=UPI003D174E0B
MNNYQDKLIQFVFLCTKFSNHHLYNRFIGLLKVHKVNDGYSEIISKLKFPFDLEYIVYELLQSAHKNNINSRRLLEDLEIIYKMAIKQIESQPRITPVWTGPIKDQGEIIYKTYETVKNLIDSAKEEVFIVGYNFSFKEKEIQDLLIRIEKAAVRNCRINFIVNKKEKNLKEIIENWGHERFYLNIYYWKGVSCEEYTSLHAKLIIIDQDKMLLTSSNFSYHGFRKNIETGVLLENHRVVKDIRNQYQLLMRNNQMEKYY